MRGGSAISKGEVEDNRRGARVLKVGVGGSEVGEEGEEDSEGSRASKEFLKVFLVRGLFFKRGFVFKRGGSARTLWESLEANDEGSVKRKIGEGKREGGGGRRAGEGEGGEGWRRGDDGGWWRRWRGR